MNLRRRWVCAASGLTCGVLLLVAAACGSETGPDSGVGAPAAALPTPDDVTTVEGPVPTPTPLATPADVTTVEGPAPTPTPSVTCDVVVDVAESADPADKVTKAFPQQDGRVFCVEFPKSFVGAPTPTATVTPAYPTPTATPSTPEEARAHARNPAPTVVPIECDFVVDVAPPGTDPMDMMQNIYVLLGGDIYCVEMAAGIRPGEVPVPDGARKEFGGPPERLMGEKVAPTPGVGSPTPTLVPTDVWLARCTLLLEALQEGLEEGSEVRISEQLDGSRVATAPDGMRVTISPDGNIHCDR